jgi:nitrite reductase/ring-hydroxylating ferredoxin subunit/uncharacterized membrane protein
MRAAFTRLEQAAGLDRVGDRLQRVVQAVLRPQAVRDTLHGVWLGHPLHPAMVQFPIGAWMSAAMLDLFRGQERAATMLVGAGVASAVPTAVAGANDWAALSPDQRRVGLVHAAGNGVALTLYSMSLSARLRGDHARGRTLAFLGLSVAGIAAYIGGHLAYKQAAQVNQSAPELHRIPQGWHPVADLAKLPQGKLVGGRVGDVAVLVYRDGDRVSVLPDRCGHETGPLSEGKIVNVDGRACVQCPWHGSVFRLDDGLVVHGPAGTDQPILRTRVVDGVVHAALP